jgi:hypothetical protein
MIVGEFDLADGPVLSAWAGFLRSVRSCPKCSYSTRNRESKQRHDSVWRHLDLGRWRLEVHARLRRLRCPEHGALAEGVPFARDGARFTRDFENLVVRHEAPLNRVGCRSPPPGCRSSSVKRGAA